MTRPLFTAALLVAGIGSVSMLNLASAQNPNDPQPPELAQQQDEHLQAAWLGVQAQPLDFETADLLQVPRGTGLYIDQVAKGSAAAEAELRPGDVILKLDDQLLINPEQLAVLIATQQPGEKVTLTILRNGEELNVPVTLGKTDANQASFGPGGKALDEPQLADPPAPRDGRGADLPRVPRLEPIQPMDLPEHMHDIERQMHEHQQQLLRFIEQIEGNRGDLRQKHQQMQQEMQRQIQQQLGEMQLPAAQRSVTIGDDEHRIQATGGPDGWQTLKITDRQGNVIYDDAYPRTDEQWLEVPDTVRDKARQMIEQGPIRLEIKPKPIKPKPEAHPIA